MLFTSLKCSFDILVFTETWIIEDRVKLCHFDDYTCWFSHKEFTSNNDNVKNDYTCKYCGDKFECKNNLMKHRKQQHEKIIATCREYIKGNCIYGYDCWYKHETQKLQKYKNNAE